MYDLMNHLVLSSLVTYLQYVYKVYKEIAICDPLLLSVSAAGVPVDWDEIPIR